jgi:7-carboxy-7-deazaguanine synthase
LPKQTKKKNLKSGQQFMSKLKIAELFYSIQGEGRFMGVPSVFLRTFGCNFTCAGFGLPRGELSNEAIEIAQVAHMFEKYEDLPLVSTGCDSYASWMPEFKNLSPMLTSEAIVDRIMEILPQDHWKDEHLVITGGEPLLGWQRAYPELLDHPNMSGLKELTAEFKAYLANWIDGDANGHLRNSDSLTFSVSAKLPCSGEKWEDAIKPEVVCEYEQVGTAYLKFVIATEQDFADAERAIAAFRAAGFKGHVYLMPVGGVESVYAMNNKNVAVLAMKNGLRYSDRLQVPLFKNEWGT